MRTSPLFLVALALGLAGVCSGQDRPPNFVVIFADDLGYGDLGVYGHPTISTPRLDRMAAEGMRFTQFYASDNVCTPSRAGLITGRYAVRSGMTSKKARVLFPNSTGGLPDSEITIAELLKQKGYATGIVGKWHLGHRSQFLPTRHGFDSYFGIPYSNDMDKVQPGLPRDQLWGENSKSEYFNVPILRDEEEIERPAFQPTVTKRYTEEAVAFIRRSREKPFFLYMPHTMVHVPLFRDKAFEGVSARGLYGDTVEEIDWSVGRILDTLHELGLDRNTLVVFTSDNGPWLTFDEQGGSAGLLRMGKGSTWEGGVREPGIFWMPGTVKEGVTQELGSTLDLLPTFAAMAGLEPPSDRELDGYDLTPVLRGTGPSPRDEFMYYRDGEVWAARVGRYKAHFKTKSGYQRDELLEHDPPLLFDLHADPSEKYDIAEQRPEVIAAIQRRVAEHSGAVVAVKDQLADRTDP